MNRTFDVAVVGATGAVGEAMIEILEQRKFPVRQLYPLASSRSAGKTVRFQGRDVPVGDLAEFDFSRAQVGLFSPGASVSAVYAPKAAAAGCVVVDNTSQFRYEDDIPLVVPEVNAEKIADYRNRGIIANPNCSTIQMLVALKPLHQLGKIKRVVVSTYQSVSGAGKPAMDELFNQTRAIYVNDPIRPEKFTKQIAFNVIPHIDVFMDDGATKEEWKMSAETCKILDPDIAVHATCVRVPVFIGHAEAINIEFHNPVTEAQARAALKNAPGVVVIDHRENDGYVTPAECAGEDAVYVSRIRKDPTIANGLSLWCVSDNLRKGAALNTIQIAEVLIRDYLKK